MISLILLGAGASYGSGDCTPYCPPLGATLFDALRARGGTAASVSPELAELFKRDFESGMVEFQKQRDADTTSLLREMAEYFVDFAAGPRNLYREIVRIVRQQPVSVRLVTTNYDLLIEQAITEAGLLIAYHPPPLPADNISLLKIHGSCHFLPDTQGLTLTDVTFAGNAVNVETRVKIARSRNEVREFCRTQDSLAPAIAVFAPGKPVLFSSEMVKDQQAKWLATLAEASVVYIIGLRVVPGDEHIWGALAKSNAAIQYVGLDKETILAWASASNRANVHFLARTFAEALPALRQRLIAA